MVLLAAGMTRSWRQLASRVEELVLTSVSVLHVAWQSALAWV
jgi:hypothetical protein